MSAPTVRGRKLPLTDFERREKERIRRAKYRAANPARVRERSRVNWAEWSATHSRKKIDSVTQAWADARRKARALGLDPGSVAKEDFARLHLLPCAYCGVMPALGVDHIVPFAKKGPNSLDNLAPSCMTCNRKKGAA